MSRNRTFVITTFGHDKTIDKIAVGIFDDAPDWRSSENADTYCEVINSLKLEGDSWINAKAVCGNTPYCLREFYPVIVSFTETIMNMDNRAIQKTLREIDSSVVGIALKHANEKVKEKIFANMSKRAIDMLKDDMECMKDVNINNSIKSQEKILNIARHLIDCGEIVLNYKYGE
jgi:flagellar motor switch protein FliG